MDEYEEYEEYEDEGRGSAVNKILIILIILLLLAVGVVGFFLIRNMTNKDTRVGLALSQEELDSAMDDAQAYAQSSSIALRYKNSAYSEDGQLFSCYLMNSQFNIYDMFVTIYTDDAMTDEVFTSGLISPGRGFDQIKLNRTLEKGTHTVNVLLTQVDIDEEGTQTIVGQASHTMDFIVD